MRELGHDSGRGAFTLIELLVVVAVLALLVATLLPALAGARRSAQGVACLSNMRQLAIAQAAYAADCDGALVDYGISHGATPELSTISWLDSLGPYFEDAPVVRSPLDTSPHWDEPIVDRFRVTSYGLNEHVTPSAPTDPATGKTLGGGVIHRLRNPAETVQWLPMAYAGDYAVSDHVHVINWWIGSFLPDAPASIAASMCQTNTRGGDAGAWSARANYASLDASAGVFRFDEVYRTAEDNRFLPR